MDKSPFTLILVLKIMVFITLSFYPIIPKFTPHNSLPTPLTQNQSPPPTTKFTPPKQTKNPTPPHATPLPTLLFINEKIKAVLGFSV